MNQILTVDKNKPKLVLSFVLGYFKRNCNKQKKEIKMFKLKTLRQDHKGFGHIEAVLAILVIAAIAGIGARVMFASHAATPSSVSGTSINKPVLGIVGNGTNNGYWLYSSDGGVFAEGSAPFYGSMGGKTLSAQIVGMSATYDKKGYYLVGADGAVYAFGDAKYSGGLNGGSSYGVISHPGTVIGIAAHNGGGYWIMTSTGATYALGGAPTLGNADGSTGIVSISTSPDGNGYYAISNTGEGYNFDTDTTCEVNNGNLNTIGAVIITSPTATKSSCFTLEADGSLTSSKNNTNVVTYGSPTVPDGQASPIVGVASTSDGTGYWMVSANGSVYSFGDAAYSYTTPLKYSTAGGYTKLGTGSIFFSGYTSIPGTKYTAYACKLVDGNSVFVTGKATTPTAPASISGAPSQTSIYLNVGSTTPPYWLTYQNFNPQATSYKAQFSATPANATASVNLSFLGFPVTLPNPVSVSSLATCAQ
jgi:hypothetical protein